MDTAKKEELLDMIQHGTEHIVNSNDSLLVNGDIEEIIQRGEEQTSELNSKYEGLTFEDLQRKALQFNPLALSKRERKLNYFVDGDPRQDFQFFCPKLAELQERELAVFKKANDIPITLPEPQGPEDTPEKLDLFKSSSTTSNRVAEPLTEEELAEKERLIAQGFEDWSRRDFQQFIRALETYGCYIPTDDFELLTSEIQDKPAEDVA
ncbi:hypothetical protein K474DRAFT_1707838 [Panus rudis PR-1116 ss-1]|nr:hypothetical protein K474DRAFT_1707838 [Panus rudis PR-1116 ss-1]